MKENSIEETNLENFKLLILDCKEHRKLYNESFVSEDDIEIMAHILSDYKRVLKENEELKKKYNSLTDKIILKIDEYDYKFEKAKKQSKNDIADYYWDLIINFKKLLGGK